MKIPELSENRRAEAQVTEQTEVSLKTFQHILKAKGYVRTSARLISAMFEWTFEREGRSIVLTGWHGTGKRGTCRWFGDLKAVLSLCDNINHIKCPNAKWKRDEMFKLDCIDGTVDDHTKMLAGIEDYLRKGA